MYDNLVKRLRNRRICIQQSGSLEDFPLLAEAADAIEELSADCDMYRKGMTDEHNKAARLLWDKEHCWIPVTERLPENLTSVIVHRKDGGIFTWEYFNTSPTDECWIDDSMNVYSFYDVTHWMPLPEPPKEE